MQKKICLIFFVSLLLLPNLIFSQSEENIILKTVQQFFDTLESRDTKLANSVLLSDGQFFSIRENNSNVNIKKTSHSIFVKNLTSSNEPLLETMHDPVVLIHKQVAIVWTKYEFYKNEEYSHTGVDAFSLLKTSEGWRIAGIIYNIE